MPPPRLPRRASVKPFRINPLLFIYAALASLVTVAVCNAFSLFLREETRSSASSDHYPVSEAREAEEQRKQSSEHEPPDAIVIDKDEDKKPATRDDDPLGYRLPEGFQTLLYRSKMFYISCENIESRPSEFTELNAVDLPPFGVVKDIESYQPKSDDEVREWKCELPPATECDIDRFSTIFLGFSPDRLSGVKQQVRQMLSNPNFKDMVEEFIFVWNNPKPLNESGTAGQVLVEWSMRDKNPFNEEESNRFRIFYPIELGFPSSLMNRYHPLIKPKSRALLYYDDDGPFYQHRAIRGNFELWKRNSDVQTGAMARAFTLSKRQQSEKDDLLGGPDELHDRKFVSHCRHKGDEISYDYRFFENFHANMVLPSGSMIHRNYMCFIWHPALANLRKFVLDHIVHPDDMTVSTIVSHVSGRAPMPYSRRVPESDHGRRLDEMVNGTSPEGMWRTKDWGKLRSIALNSVISYFGAINSGSYGWCYKTDYHKKGKGRRHVCEPEMARDGMLPWMTKGGYGNDICP